MVMTPAIDPRQSAPARQLSETGDCQSDNIMKAATEALTNRELMALEAEIKLYADTGLVGVYMSRLLGLLRLEHMAEVA